MYLKTVSDRWDYLLLMLLVCVSQEHFPALGCGCYGGTRPRVHQPFTCPFSLRDLEEAWSFSIGEIRIAGYATDDAFSVATVQFLKQRWFVRNISSPVWFHWVQDSSWVSGKLWRLSCPPHRANHRWNYLELGVWVPITALWSQCSF